MNLFHFEMTTKVLRTLCALQIVLTLDVYGVKRMLGITYGYRGFFEESLEPIVVSVSVLCASPVDNVK